MRRVPLTRGVVALVDNEDYSKVSKYEWHLDQRTPILGYASTSINRRELRMHRLILNAPPGVEIDHIDGNGLDNRKANLRLATRSQNTWNARPRSSRRYKGVTKQSRLTMRPWQARLAYRGKQLHLGYFPTAREAALAYDQAAQKHYKEFARCNGVVGSLSDDGRRDIVRRWVTPNLTSRGQVVVCLLSCGHSKQWFYFRRGRIGKYTHCGVCLQVLAMEGIK